MPLAIMAITLRRDEPFRECIFEGRMQVGRSAIGGLTIHTRQNIDCSGALYLIAMSFVTNGSPPPNRDSTPPITMPDDNNVRSIG
ncbi:MAG: hypothetical protein WKF77_04265 [Planctomycetaceae bacterium]